MDHLIVRSKLPIYFESFGVRSVVTKPRMTPDTIFRIYSMSKVVNRVDGAQVEDKGNIHHFLGLDRFAEIRQLVHASVVNLSRRRQSYFQNLRREISQR